MFAGSFGTKIGSFLNAICVLGSCSNLKIRQIPQICQCARAEAKRDKMSSRN